MSGDDGRGSFGLDRNCGSVVLLSSGTVAGPDTETRLEISSVPLALADLAPAQNREGSRLEPLCGRRQ
jgi:hypothetical protein